jgi:hypothetical protein
MDNAIKKFAWDLNKDEVLGLYDTTVMNTGKNGYIFTDTKIYYLETLGKPRVLRYSDIKDIEIFNTDKKDNERGIRFKLFNGTIIDWTASYLNKTPLYNFIKELIALDNNLDNQINTEVKFEQKNYEGAVAGGISLGNYQQVNKLFDEEKFHARQGHGFAAERANDLYDRLTGHDSHIVGDDNKINGADRIVDGVYIQSKYCDSGAACINECFDKTGKFRYYMENGKPMQIEVPSDMYDKAVEAMQKKIENGQIEGVTNPEEAKNIVRRGHFTYQQAKNIAKAGTVESLTYDSVNGVITGAQCFGVTAVITFASNMWNGESFEDSLKIATYSGLKVGGTAFATTVIASQLSKAGLNSALVGSSEAIVTFMGPKASAVLVNAFRSSGNIYGAAAMKSAAKLLRGNAITAGATVIVLSSFDVANIFRGRISGKQLFKNLANTTTTVVGGTGGWMAGAAVGSAILPGVGTVIGGLIGSIGAGAVAGKATNAVLGTFIEDDADEMVRIIEKEFSNLAVDYLLSQEEAEVICDNMSEVIDGNLLKDMFSSSNRKKFARNIIEPFMEKQVTKRKHIKALSNEQMVSALKGVLEEISEQNESKN